MPQRTDRATAQRYDPSTKPAPEPCVTCGSPVTSLYCAECGERRASDRSYSIWVFIREHVIEAVMSFDGGLIRTTKTLITKPGELTAAFMRGVRVPYLPPLQCFLLFNVDFFLWSSIAGMRVLDTPLTVHMHGMAYSEMATRMVNEKLARTHEPLAAYATRFNAVGSAEARSLVLVMVPVFALLVALVTFRKRRPAVQHLVFGLHTYAFLFLVSPFIIYAIAIPLAAARHVLGVKEGPYGYDEQMSFALLVAIAVYIAWSLRRAYAMGRASSTIAAIVLTLAIGQIIQDYRRLLFFVTLWTT